MKTVDKFIKGFNSDYLIKVISQFFRIPLQFLIQGLLIRILGISSYGSFEYLNDLGVKITGFIDNGISQAYYNRLSRGRFYTKINSAYLLIFFFLLITYSLLVIVILNTELRDVILPNIPLKGPLGFILIGISTFMITNSFKIYDALNQTKQGEVLKNITLTTTAILLVILLKSNHTDDDLDSVIIIYSLSQISISIIMVVRLQRVINHFRFVVDRFKNIKKILYHFILFSSPLFYYNFVGLLLGLGERWLIQYYSGSLDQAYYSIGLKLNGISLLITTSVLPLFVRKMNKLDLLQKEEGLIKKAQYFINSTRVFSTITAIIGFLTLFNLDFILNLLNVEKVPVIYQIIILFYPVAILQTIGQINTSYFYSSNRTKIYAKWMILLMLTSIVLNIWLVVPERYFGLNLGSRGIIIQLIITQVLSTIIFTYINTRHLNLADRKYLIIKNFISPFCICIVGIIISNYSYLMDIPYYVRLMLSIILILVLLFWFSKQFDKLLTYE